MDDHHPGQRLRGRQRPHQRLRPLGAGSARPRGRRNRPPMTAAQLESPEYDRWSSLWWQRRGPFASLRWLARERATHVPSATAHGAVLLDVACGGGLLHPFIAGKGYRHVGVDLSTKSAEV